MNNEPIESAPGAAATDASVRDQEDTGAAPRRPTGQGPVPTPPPGCPAGGPGAAGPRRLHEAAEPNDLYVELRAEHGPVAPVLIHDDVPVWVVLGHAENLRLVSTPAVFSRDSRIWTPLAEGMVKPDHPLMPHIAWQPIASHAEGEEHKRLRAAVAGAMATIDYRGLRRYVRRHSRILVNRFCERGRADLVGGFAEHLPMAVLCEIFGMPEEYGDRLVGAARDALKGTDTAIESHAHVMEILERHTARRRAQPAEDFTSHLVDHPARLTDDEVREHLRLVLFAAYEATVNLISNVLRVVLTDPRFRARLSGGEMTVPEAVEQSLWDEPPFSTVFAYFAKQDTELGGRRIRRGDGLLFGIAPGNVDPRIRPDLSAGMRGNRSHLAFGGGPHECPGQDIGRVIADAGVDALLMRLPDVRLDCPEEVLRWRSSIASRQLVSLPVRFEPRQPEPVSTPPGRSPVPRGEGLWHRGERPAADPTERVFVSPAETGDDLLRPPSKDPEDAVPPRGVWHRLLRWWRGYE